MRNERLEILTALYATALTFDNLEYEFLISDREGKIDGLFQYQYLEHKGYLDLIPDDCGLNKCYAVLTANGVDVVEQNLKEVDDDTFENIFSNSLKLRLERLERVWGI